MKRSPGRLGWPPSTLAVVLEQHRVKLVPEVHLTAHERAHLAQLRRGELGV
jgi:hypothetical protein